MRVATLAWGLAIVPFLFVVTSLPAPTPRCPEGLVAIGARCCGEGQVLRGGSCVGKATRCAAELVAGDDGCVPPERRVTIPAGAASWLPPDDRAAGAGGAVASEAFAIDVYEVTWSRWRACDRDDRCPRLNAGEPGQPVVGVTLDEARAFCAWAGGRLPRDAEWLRAQSGDVDLRYPWGDPDALCLRATYGLRDGPCARGGVSAEVTGARPWGATARGVMDMAGNVAEMVEGGAPEGSVVVRGGAWIDDERMALRAQWRRVVPAGGREAWIGFRCVYAP